MADKPASDQSHYEYFLWDIPPVGITGEQLKDIAANACRGYDTIPQISCSAVFYPYSDLKSTIKIEKDQIRIRISDILSDASGEVLEALIHILIARVLRRKPRTVWIDCFNKYIQRPEVEANHARLRRMRNRKILSAPQGKHHDLDRSFHRVNQRYFQDTLAKPKLSWSPHRSRRQLGYHDASLNLIVISRYLDRPNVPEFMIDYLMYHELLHTLIRPEIRRGKRIVHSANFRRYERKFERYDEAIRWLKETR